MRAEPLSFIPAESMQEAIETIFGVLAGAAAAILGGKLSSAREREVAIDAWKHERQAAEERQSKAYQHQNVEWIHTRLLEAYSNALHCLVKLGVSVGERSHDDPEVRQQYVEAHRYLLLIRTLTDDANAIQELANCSHALERHFHDQEMISSVADACCRTVRTLIRAESRPNSISQ